MGLLDYLGSAESSFFRGGRFNAGEMIGALVEEAVLLGAEDISVPVRARWNFVASSHDRLGSTRRDPFSEIVSYPESGQNSMLAEVMLTADRAEIRWSRRRRRGTPA